MVNKIKISLNKSFQDLDGTETELKMGKTLAGQLANASEGDAIKFFGWGLELNSGKDLEVDESDFKTIESFIKGQKMPNWMKAQLIKALDNAKEASK